MELGRFDGDDVPRYVVSPVDPALTIDLQDPERSTVRCGWCHGIYELRQMDAHVSHTHLQEVLG